LGGITPPGFEDIQTEIGRMADMVSGLGGITPPGFEDRQAEIGRMANLVEGLGGITPPGFEDIQDIITQMGLDVRGLPGMADFDPLGEQIAGYGASIADLGQTDVDWTPIEEQIGGFQTAIEGLGDAIPDFDNWEDFFAWADTQDGEVPGEVPEEQQDLIAQLQKIILDLSGADPMDADALRADPVNASLLLDLENRMEEEQGQMIEDMQRLGILASGETAGELADLSEAEARAVSDILSSGAERARADRETGLARGVDLSGIISDRDIATAELIGRTISGEQTIGGQQADLDVIGSVMAIMDPSLDISQEVRMALAQAIMRSSWRGSDKDRLEIEAALGISGEDPGSGGGEPEYYFPGDTYHDADTNKFIQDNFPGKYLRIHPGVAMFDSGTPDNPKRVPPRVAIWDSYKNEWVLA
jgi:hypothetical protein